MAFDLDDQELEYTRRLYAERKSNMILPRKEKKVTLKDVSLGTAYDINKNLVKKYEKELTAEELKEKELLINKFTIEKKDHYYMMLCHDRRDYTIFHTDILRSSVYDELLECLQNRGTIVGIDKTTDDAAIEIWLMIDEEAYCYYFFPYEDAVVEY